MLYAFAFEQVGVVVGDLYFVDPNPRAGQEGAERGVRLEVRRFERPPVEGSVYAAQAIHVARPIWRADLLERVDGPIGSFDRTHHHPQFRGWEPSRRKFEPELSAHPVEYVGAMLADLDALLAGAEMTADDVAPSDADDLRAATPEILDVVRRLLARVHAGELATAPAGADGGLTRAGWL
jgi:hypothetical protein